MADKKNSFVPYRYIKEFYNSERLILPAVRNTVLNGIFLGGARSKEKGDTLLDTVNYPIFDLWAFIIQQYRYSFFETTRGELIVVPDMMSCLPPLCNVVFPDEYVHYGRNIDLRGITTRFFEQGFLTLTGNDSIYSDINEDMDKQQTAQQAFVAPTSDVEPLIYKVIAGECTPKEIPSSTPEDNFEAYTQIPLPDEFHYGANYKTGSGEYLSKMSEDYVRTKLGSAPVDDSGTKTTDVGSDPNQDQDTEDHINLEDEYNNYHKLNVNYKYFLSRLYSQKTENVRITFTPRLVVGLPILLLSRTGKHLLGLLTNLSHNISAEGIAETIATVEYQYNYDDITKRPVYFYRQGDREKLIQQSGDSEDEATYVWKNYYMLSAYFRDKFIGENMYKKILCDGIEEADYNIYARKGLKDKSILGILSSSGDTDPEILSDKQKSSTGGEPQRELDKAYFDDDRPNVTGEIQSIPVGSESKMRVTAAFKAEMSKQQKRMFYAIETIWAGYLTAYNKDVYKAKFDIYPLRDFDYWMRDLGAYRQKDTGNFVGGKKKSTNWVAEAEKEMEARFKKYQKKETENKEEKEKQKEDLEKKVRDAKMKRDIALERFEDAKRNYTAPPTGKDAIFKGTPVNPNIHAEDTEQKQKEALKKQGAEKEYNEAEQERMKYENELKAAQNSLKEFTKSVKFDSEEIWKENQEAIIQNEDYRKYDFGNRKFTTNGPFCIEKQNYFRDVYSKGLKEFHFDTEFRTFEINPQIPKDVGNQINVITHKKGTGHTAPTNTSQEDKVLNNPNSTEEEKKKAQEEKNRKNREKTDKEMNQRYSNVKKYVAALWALTWAYGNKYEWKGNDDFIVINGKTYDRNKTDAVKHYIYLMDTKIQGLWTVPVKEWGARVSWKPNTYNFDDSEWKKRMGHDQSFTSWTRMQAVFENYGKNYTEYKIMEEMWVVYEKLVNSKIINPAKAEDLK